MSKEASLKNRDRFIQLGIAVATVRKINGMSQEKLAEAAGVSRSCISALEAPNYVRAISLEVLYNIADALKVNPADLLYLSECPEQILNVKKDIDIGNIKPSVQ